MSYQQALSGWHDFYILAGTAAAMVIPQDRSTAAIELIASGVASLVIATPSLVAAPRAGNGHYRCAGAIAPACSCVLA